MILGLFCDFFFFFLTTLNEKCVLCNARWFIEAKKPPGSYSSLLFWIQAFLWVFFLLELSFLCISSASFRITWSWILNNFAWKVFSSALLLYSHEYGPGSSSELHLVYLKHTDWNRNFIHVTHLCSHTNFSGLKTLECSLPLEKGE